MDLRKLFHVLVVGGSVMPGCSDPGGSRGPTSGDARTEAETPAVSADAEVARETMAGEEVRDETGSLDATHDEGAGSETSSSDATRDEREAASPAALCFCSLTARCCEAHDGSAATVASGFVCCWATSC
jgi:hypothetical protein